MRNKVLILAISSIAATLIYGWPSTVCNSSGLQLFPLLVSNQKLDGGAIICWADQRAGHYEIYAKEIRGSDGGTASDWDPNGDVVSLPPSEFTPYGHRLNHVATYGNVGEIIVAWVNHHSLTYIVGTDTFGYKPGIYAQKMKEGSPQWYKWGPGNEIGVEITTASKNQPSLANDGAGGCIIAWMEYNANTKIYKVMATRLDSVGDLHSDWQTNPVPIYSGTNRLGNPRLAVVGSYVVVVYDETETSDESIDSWNPAKGGSTYLKATRIDKNTGGDDTTAILETRSNETECSPAEMRGNLCKPYVWDYLDYPLAVSGNFLYIGELVAMKLRNRGEYKYYHAHRLEIILRKLDIAGMDTLWNKTLDSDTWGNECTSGWIFFDSAAPIENLRIRTPVIAPRSDGGAVVVYTQTPATLTYEASDQTATVDSRQWDLKIKYADASGNINDISYSTVGKAHTPGVISTNGDSCIITYGSYNAGSTVHTMLVKNSGKVWDSTDSLSYYSCSPRIIKTDATHFIVVWSSGASQSASDWNIYAQRRRIDNGNPQ